MTHRSFQGGAVLVLSLLLVGCGRTNNTANVSGLVSYQNAPLTVGTVTFLSDSNKVATSPIDANGNYKLTDAPVGPVKIGVSVPAPSPPPPPGVSIPGGNVPQSRVRIPAAYATPATSNLTYTVTAGSQTHNIELK